MRFGYCSIVMGTILLIAASVLAVPDEGKSDGFQRTGWTSKTKQLFEHAPSFEFTSIPDATSYRFTVTSPDGLREVIRSDTPEIHLNPIWLKLPKTGAFTATVEPLSAENEPLAELSFTFEKKQPYEGQSLPKQSDYGKAGFETLQFMMDTLAGRRPELRSFTVKPGGAHGWPGLFYSAQLRLLAVGAKYGPPETAKEAISHIPTFTDWLLERSTPADWAWPHVPPTQSIHGENNVIQPARIGLLGDAYMDVLEVKEDQQLLKAAMKMADTLKARQLPEGRWPFRVNAKTGETVIDYTSDQIEIVMFLERLINHYDRKDLQPVVDRAIHWTLEGPATNYRWEGQYDDMAGFEPYKGLEWYDTGFFIIYLLDHADDSNNYHALAEDLLRYIEDQFIVWGYSAEYITPGALEQYNCYQFVDYSIAHYIKICMAFHRATGVKIYLQKAKTMANTLTNLQHPDGWFACQHPTHKGDESKLGTIGEIQFKADWGLNYLPNCSAYSGEMLIRFDRYLDSLESTD